MHPKLRAHNIIDPSYIRRILAAVARLYHCFVWPWRSIQVSVGKSSAWTPQSRLVPRLHFSRFEIVSNCVHSWSGLTCECACVYANVKKLGSFTPTNGGVADSAGNTPEKKAGNRFRSDPQKKVKTNAARHLIFIISLTGIRRAFIPANSHQHRVIHAQKRIGKSGFVRTNQTLFVHTGPREICQPFFHWIPNGITDSVPGQVDEIFICPSGESYRSDNVAWIWKARRCLNELPRGPKR